MVHEADALRFDFGALGAGPRTLRVVGNLPYNISTPLLFHLLGFGEVIKDLHVMLQREVVDRMTAAPGGKEYGRLTVMLALWTKCEALFDVGPGAFTPPPKVWSTVVRLTPHTAPPFPVRDHARFAKLVAHLFSMRRKTLGRSLKGQLTRSADHSRRHRPHSAPRNARPLRFRSSLLPPIKRSPASLCDTACPRLGDGANRDGGVRGPLAGHAGNRIPAARLRTSLCADGPARSPLTPPSLAE